jgi:hypothetical protein
MENSKRKHRVDIYRGVTGRRKHAETYVFMYPLFFSSTRAKNDQLRVLGKFRER